MAKNDFQYGEWNSSTLQCGVCVCVSVKLSVNSPTGQTPQRIFTIDSLTDADLPKDVSVFRGSR